MGVAEKSRLVKARKKHFEFQGWRTTIGRGNGRQQNITQQHTATIMGAFVKVSSLAMSCLHKISCSVQAAPASWSYSRLSNVSFALRWAARKQKHRLKFRQMCIVEHNCVVMCGPTFVLVVFSCPGRVQGRHSNNFGSQCFCFRAAQRRAKLTFKCSYKISWPGLPGLNNLFYVGKTSPNCSLIQKLQILLLWRVQKQPK